jgi:hypothetical protein
MGLENRTTIAMQGGEREGHVPPQLPPAATGRPDEAPGGQDPSPSRPRNSDQRALVPGPLDDHGGRVPVSRPVAAPLAAGGDSNGRKPSTVLGLRPPQPFAAAGGQGREGALVD